MLLGAALVLACAAVAVVWAAMRLAAFLDGTAPPTGNPLEVALGVVRGRTAWPDSATTALVVLAALALVPAAAAGWLWARRARRRTRVDRAAPRMGGGGQIASVTQRGAAAAAARLGAPGLGAPIGATVNGGNRLYASWEDVCVDVWGPRLGKTTSRAIPAVLEAPGAVVATSNKRDLVDATRDVREQVGRRAWVFDPQGIAGEEPRWWWNPLSYVTDEVKAATLAGIFASATAPEGAKQDAFFTPAAQSLLAGLLLAAALDERPITDVYLWLADPTDDRAVTVLRRDGYALEAAEVAGHVHAPDKQRAGVYATARGMVAFLRNRQAAQWITPAGAGESVFAGMRPQFSPADFVRSTETLYSLSKEGEGTSGPVTAALTVAVMEAAEELATTQPGGRLRTPMVVVLDEAANVCRWNQLPDKYSHYGSRGICLMTFLQSWSQGVSAWGQVGMSKLWSAANIKVYGGGVDEKDFLERISAIVGDYEYTKDSVSQSKTGRTTSQQSARERILDVADLAALPKGRAVLFSSGNPPVLVRTLPWMSGPHAGAVAASIRAHDPAGEAVIAEAMQAVAATAGPGRGYPDSPARQAR